MIIDYLLSNQDEERLGEIVDELICSDFIRRILQYGDEHLGAGLEVGLALQAVANPRLEFNKGRIIFRDEKLQNLARYKTLLLPIADILFFAGGEGYSYALLEEGNSQDIVDEIRGCDDYAALVATAERYGFIDERVLKQWEARGREHLRNFFANVKNRQLPEYALAQDQAKDLDRDKSDLHKRYKEGRQFRQVRLEGIAMLSKAERRVYLIGDYFYNEDYIQGGVPDKIHLLYMYEGGRLLDLNPKPDANDRVIFPAIYIGFSILHDTVRIPHVYEMIRGFLRKQA